jgi:GNAT superfamily N-acetyltransferase
VSRLHFRLEPWLADFYYEPSEVLVAFLGKQDVGRLSFYTNRKSELLHLETLLVNPAFRGRGIGVALHQELRKLVQRRWPWQQYATGQVTSVGALRLLAKVYGKPLYIADDIRRYSFEEASKCLPCLGRVDAQSQIDCSGGYLDVNVWLGRGLPPAHHPWREEQ